MHVFNSNFSNLSILCFSQSKDVVGDEFSAYGISLASRPVSDRAMRGSSLIPLPEEEDSIKEIPWTLSNMLERYSFKATYPWLTTDASHTVLAHLNLPQDLITNDITANPFKSFCFWRGDIEIDIQVIGTPFHQGKIMATFFPLLLDSQADLQVFNFASCMVNPTLHLFPNANSNGKLIIPFNSIQRYLDLTNADTDGIGILGSLLIYVMNPLTMSASASDTVSVSVFSRFVNNEFKVPRLSSVLPSQTIFAVPQSGPSAPNVMSHLKHSASSAISNLMDTVLPDNIVSDALGLLLDKPIDLNQKSNVMTIVGRFNNATGVENIERMTNTSSHISTCSHTTFGVDIDEMDFNYLKKKESYLGTFQVKVGDEVGAILASFPINPVAFNFTANTNNKLPLLSYLSLPYAFWRGGLTYRFEVVATSNQTAKMFVGFNFNSFSINPSLPINSTTSQYGKAFEINQGTNNIIVTVPFVSDTDYKFVPNSNTYTSANSTGYVNVTLMNCLVCPNNTPTTIFVNVYLSGADDFEVSSLTMANNVICAVPQSTDVAPPLMSGDTSIDLSKDAVVAPPSNVTPRSTNVEPPVLHIQRILKKYQPVGRMQKIGNDGGYYVCAYPLSSLFGVPRDAIVPDPQPPVRMIQNGLFTHYSAIYRQFKGGLRFKIIDRYDEGQNFSASPIYAFYVPPMMNNNNVMTDYTQLMPNLISTLNTNIGSPVIASLPAYSSYIRLPLTLTLGATVRSLEFEIPFSSRFNSVMTYHELINPELSLANPRTDLGTIFYCTATNGLEMPFVYASFADEARFGALCQVPTVNCPMGWDGSFFSSNPDDYSTTPATTNTLTVL